VRHATLRFYGELNDFLPARLRQRTICRGFEALPSVKDLIESCGVPHTEVDLVLIDGDAVDFGRAVADGDRVVAYPRFHALELPAGMGLQPAPLSSPRFVLDIHLGRLAGYLRLAGFDTAYRNDFSDEDLAEASRDEDRILLTRDRELLKRAIISRGYFVRQTSPRRQLAEIIRRFDIARAMAPFTRCARCNGVLAPVAKEAVAHELPAHVRLTRGAFLRCPGCGRVYWDGTHVDQIRRFLRLALEEPPPA
jgi:uncharacterized protein with PIN domain